MLECEREKLLLSLDAACAATVKEELELDSGNERHAREEERRDEAGSGGRWRGN